MASINAQQGNSPSSTTADADPPINKRQTIGLSARRPTAPDTVQRPPDARSGFSAWWLVFWLSLLIVASGLLIVARSLQPNTTLGDLMPGSGRSTSAPAAPPYVQETFDADNGMLPAYTEPGLAAAAVLPTEGVYRLDVWPGKLAWSRFQVEDVTALRLDVEATIDAQTPEAATALIGRFEDDANFYLFTVDGKGRFGVIRYQGDTATVLRPPTPLPALNVAGALNRLTLEDNGTSLRFLGNGILLDIVPVEPAPATQIGFGALATDEDIATVTFDSLTILRL